MQDPVDATSVRDLVAIIGDAPDVRALLDRSQPPVTIELLPNLKSEIDRLVYADRPAASRLVDAAAWAADRLGDDASQAFASASRARLLYAEARYAEAATLFETSTVALRVAGHTRDAAALTKQHIVSLMYLGRYDEALDLARIAKSTLRRLRDPRLLAEHETNVGNLHYRRDHYRKALGCYERARVIFERLGDSVALAYTDHNCATVLVDLDRADEALELYARAGAAYAENGLQTLDLEVQLAVAYIEYLKGHYYEALRRFNSVHEAGGTILNAADRALTDLDLAAVYLHLNSLGDAADAADRAAAGFGSAGMTRELGNARRMRAVAAARMGDDETAAVIFDEVIGLYEDGGNPVQLALTQLELAAVALHRGDFAAADDAARAAARPLGREALAPKRRLARVLEARAALGLGDVGRASRVARAALKSAADSEDDAVAYQCHAVLAQVARARGQRQVALDSFRSAIAAVERMRSRIVVDNLKTRFLEDKVELYEGAVELCLDEETPERTAEALRTLELAKSRSLSDLLSGYLREFVPGGESGRAARARFKSLVDELAWYRSKLDRSDNEPPSGEGARRELRRRTHEVELCEARVTAAFQRLQVEDERFAELQAPRVADAEELQALVAEDEAIVEFLEAGDHYSAIVVTRDGLTAVRHLAPATEVNRLLEGLRFQMDKFVYGREFADREIVHLRRSADVYLAKLYEALLAPIERAAGGRDLVVVPHGRLHYVPMHALLNGNQYVIEQRGVSYAPSATVFALCSPERERSTAPPLLCGVSDVSAPEIAREIEMLGRLFPAATVLTGDGVTREAVAREAESCGILHIASHAVFRSDNPMLSSLRLSDGDLTFYDVFNLRVSADLVVLSGCNTGTVAVGAGDELHGLMRGFLYAGAPSLLISMWAADDASTASLMRTFYSELLNGSTKRNALRAAQRAAMETHGHPYYWAPFTLLGRAV